MVALGANANEVDAGASRRLFGSTAMGMAPRPVTHMSDSAPQVGSLQKPLAEIAKLEEDSEAMQLEILRMESQLDQMQYSQKLKQQQDQGSWSTVLGGLSGVALLGLGIKGGLSAVSGFTTRGRAPLSAVSMSAAEEGIAGTNEPIARREFLSKVAGASALLGAAAANAEVDYAGVGFLGGSKTIDVNNANVRVYTKLPGMYPGAAGKIVSNVPYKDKSDIYAKANFTPAQAEAVKKYDSNFIFLEPRPEYVIDNINNGLYR
jgi:photosystem II PsbU protein